MACRRLNHAKGTDLYKMRVFLNDEPLLRKLVAVHYPAMGDHLLERDALAWVDVEHARDEVLCTNRDQVPVSSGQCELALADACQYYFGGVIRTVGERRVPVNQRTLASKLSSMLTVKEIITGIKPTMSKRMK